MSPPPTATRRLHPITFFVEEAVHRPLEDLQTTKFRLLARCAGLDYNITAEEFDSPDEAAQTLVALLESIGELVPPSAMHDAITAGVTAGMGTFEMSFTDKLMRQGREVIALRSRLEALDDVAVTANQIAVSAKGVADSAHSSVGEFSRQLSNHVNKRKH